MDDERLSFLRNTIRCFRDSFTNLSHEELKALYGMHEKVLHQDEDRGMLVSPEQRLFSHVSVLVLRNMIDETAVPF